jgi:hypothetical protein
MSFGTAVAYISEYERGRALMAIEWVARGQKPIVEVGGYPIKACDFAALARDLNDCIARSGEPVMGFIIPDRMRDYCCYGFYRYPWAMRALLETWKAPRWPPDSRRWLWLQGLLFGYSADAIQRFISSASGGSGSNSPAHRRKAGRAYPGRVCLRKVEIYGPLARLVRRRNIPNGKRRK